MVPLSQLVNSRLLEQARLFEAMTARLRRELPQAIAARCWVAGCRQRTLLVVTDNATFGVSVRYRQHEILTRLNAELGLEPPVNAMKVKIRGVEAGISSPARRRDRPTMSQSSGRCLAETAAGLRDPGLAEALRRLARRGG